MQPMPTARHSAFRRCRWNGMAPASATALKFRRSAPIPLPYSPNSSPRQSAPPATHSEDLMSNVHDIYPDDRIILREVGLRDGPPLVKTFPATAAKRKWIGREYDAGVRHFEVGSFLSAKTFPQFADVLDIVAAIAALPGAHGIGLAVEARGVAAALAAGVAEIGTVVSATEEHSRANANRSRDQAIDNVRR